MRFSCHILCGFFTPADLFNAILFFLREKTLGRSKFHLHFSTFLCVSKCTLLLLSCEFIILLTLYIITGCYCYRCTCHVG